MIKTGDLERRPVGMPRHLLWPRLLPPGAAVAVAGFAVVLVFVGWVWLLTWAGGA